MLTRYKSIIPNFALGLNPVISSKGISKEMILLPPKFRVKNIDKWANFSIFLFLLEK